jgi:hypothetical protein
VNHAAFENAGGAAVSSSHLESARSENKPGEDRGSQVRTRLSAGGRLIQHDCGQHAFFERGRMNDWAGRAIGVLTLTPYEYWRRGHALHHAYSGNLDRRGFWDVPMLTGRQFRATFTRDVSSHDQSNISSLHRTLDLFPLHRRKILAAKKPTLAGARIDAHDLAGQRFG